MTADVEISTDPTRLDIDVVCKFQQTSYWAKGRRRSVMAPTFCCGTTIRVVDRDGSAIGTSFENTEDAMSAENRTLVRRWFEEVWNKGRAAAIDELLAGNAVLHGFGPQPTTSADFKNFHTAYRNAFPDVSIRIDAMVAEGDVVAVRWSAKGTHRGDGLGISATGKTAEFSGMGFVRIEGGKIVEGWNLFDQLGMFTQLGIVALPI